MRLAKGLSIGLCVGLVTVSAPTADSQGRKLKVLLLCDMEGITGADDYKKTEYSHPEEYAQGRQSLTADVNAAIAGLKAAGASDIVIVDGHGSGNATGPDVLENEVMPPAKVHYRDTPFDVYMDSYDHSFDAIVAIGMHAGAGNRSGFLAHTYSAEDVEYRVNGLPFNETMILAMGAARLKIPVIMASGDDQLEKEISRNMPWVRYATVKHAASFSRAVPLSRAEASRRIESAARDALQSLERAKVMEFSGPYRFALQFQDEGQARNAALLPTSELLADGVTVQIRANDFEEGYRLSSRLMDLASAIGGRTAIQAVINAQPNARQLRVSIGDWVNERLLNGLPEAVSKSKSRFWGAR